MKHPVKAAALLALALALCLVFPVSAESSNGYLGQPLPDFTVTTLDGGVFTLSQVLKEKDMVLINLWATWCGPCDMEFPYLEEAYEQYRDRVEVIALSVEPDDTPDMLAAYAKERGLTFPIGSDTETGLGYIFATEGIPTSVAVDRFGNVALVEVGAQITAEPFANLFDLMTGEEYTETRVLDGFPKSRPTVEAGAEGQLAAAAGMDFYVASSDDDYAWPFLAGETDGKSCIYSSNAGKDDSTAKVDVVAKAMEGDVFSFRIKVSSEASYDFATISLNNETVKKFSGEVDWTPYAVALKEGENVVTIAYEKDQMESAGADTVYLSDFALLSGDAAQAALDANPVYPFAEETRLDLISEGAREIVFNEVTEGALTAGIPDMVFYIAGGDTAVFEAGIGSELDPDDVIILRDPDGAAWNAYDILSMPLTAYIDTMQTTGYSRTSMLMVHASDYSFIKFVMVFRDEANANAQAQEWIDEGLITGWNYADGSLPATDEIAVPVGVTPVWTVFFTDQDGNPVPGCIVNFCTDQACTPVVADEDGVAVFEGEPYAYHLQVIRVPNGYKFDTAQEFYAEENGGEMIFTVTKE